MRADIALFILGHFMKTGGKGRDGRIFFNTVTFRKRLKRYLWRVEYYKDAGELSYEIDPAFVDTTEEVLGGCFEVFEPGFARIAESEFCTGVITAKGLNEMKEIIKRIYYVPDENQVVDVLAGSEVLEVINRALNHNPSVSGLILDNTAFKLSPSPIIHHGLSRVLIDES